MFSQPTVFIVGAGASSEVGLPIGNELTTTIARKLNFDSDGFRLTSGDKNIYAAIDQYSRDTSPRNRSLLYEAGRSIASAMGQSLSIDNFLHTHSHDESIVMMGKIGIASSILEAEQRSAMSTNGDSNASIKLHNTANTWYNTLFSMLYEGVVFPEIDSLFDNISFITFNYDRCIEHYLPSAIANYYLIPLEDAKILTRNLKIIHPYGQVGPLPGDPKKAGIPFGAKPDYRNIFATSSQIRTFTEGIDDEEMIDKMHSIIASAAVIVYLGFSFGDMNMKILKVENLNSKRVFATTYMMSNSNASTAKIDIDLSLGKKFMRRIELADMKCNQLLLDYRKAILRG